MSDRSNADDGERPWILIAFLASHLFVYSFCLLNACLGRVIFPIHPPSAEQRITWVLVPAGGPISLALVEDSLRGAVFAALTLFAFAMGLRFRRLALVWVLSLGVWPIWFYWGEKAAWLSNWIIMLPWREYTPMPR